MLSEPNISYKPFWGICRPLNSWRANSPNPIQIYCADVNTAITQIKEKKYPSVLEKYKDNLILVGITYDKKTRKHICKIERL